MYNKFTIGDVVGHNEAVSLKFRIIGVLPSEPDKEGDYAYSYAQIVDENYISDMESIFDEKGHGVYMERDLFFIRKATYDELSKMLDEAIQRQHWFTTLADEIRNQREKLLNQNYN